MGIMEIYAWVHRIDRIDQENFTMNCSWWTFIHVVHTETHELIKTV